MDTHNVSGEDFVEEFTDDFADEPVISTNPEASYVDSSFNDGSFDDDISDEEGAEASSYIKFLTGNGYVISDSTSFDDLEFLYERSQSLKDVAENAEEFMQVRKADREHVRHLITNSRSITVDDSDRKDFEDAQMYNTIVESDEFAVLDSEARGIIMDMYMEYGRVGVPVSKISAEEVFQKLRLRKYPLANVIVSPSAVIDHLRSFIPYCLNSFDKTLKKTLERNDTYNADVIEDNLLVYLEAWDKYRASDIALIKQITSSSAGYSFKCAECGKSITLTTFPELIISFPVTKEVKTDWVYPIMLPIVCQCGKPHSFFAKDYLDVFSTFCKKEGVALKGRAQKAAKYGEGCAIISVKPSIEYVETALSAIIVNDTKEVAEPVTDSAKEEIPSVFNSTDLFYASQALYRRIQTLNCEKRNDSLVQTAAFMCLCAGRDYRQEINRALFSVVEFISENEFLDSCLNVARIHKIHSQINVYKYYLSIFDNHAIASLCGEYNKEKGVVLDINSASGVQDLKEKFEKFIFELEDEYEQAISLYNQTINSLSTHADSFYYLELTNSSQVVKQIHQYVFDADAFKVFYQIANGMLITNYAECFYDFWVGLGKINVSYLNRVLFEQSYTGNTAKFVKNSVSKMLEEKLGITTRLDFSRFNSCYNLYDSYTECMNILNDVKQMNFEAFVNDSFDYLRIVSNDPIHESAQHSLYLVKPLLSTDNGKADFESYLSIGDPLIEVIGDCLHTVKSRNDDIKFSFMTSLLFECINKLSNDDLMKVIGVSKNQLSGIELDLNKLETSYAVDAANDVFELLHGIYFTSVSSAIEELHAEYDSLKVFDTDDLISILSLNDFKKRIFSVLDSSSDTAMGGESSANFEDDGGVTNVASELMCNCRTEEFKALLRRY